MSAPLFPVTLLGILIQGKRFGVYDVSAAVLMSLGLVLFTLADNSVSPNFDSRGYVMISLALVADAVIGNVQEKVIKAHKAPNSEVVFYSYAIGCGYILVGTLLSNELPEAFRFFGQVSGWAPISAVFSTRASTRTRCCSACWATRASAWC